MVASKIFDMCWYQWLSLAALILCKLLFICRFFRLLKMGAPKDLSKPSGSTCSGVLYSFTAAMSPANKESAYLHLPTFTAGVFFHIGTFVSMLTFIWFLIATWFNLTTPLILSQVLAIVLIITFLNGASIFVKRVAKKELRDMSGFDDYFSNGISSLVQLFTALYLLCPCVAQVYYILVAIMFLWLPIGKTKHLLYFFFARYHLGFFYGWRGTWPLKKS